MKDILVLKNTAYAKAKEGTSVNNVFEADNLEDGALCIFNEDGTPVTAAADLADSKFVTFAVGRGSLGAYVTRPIMRRLVKEVNITKYREPVAPLIVVGGTTAETGINFDVLYNINAPGQSLNEATIRVQDTTLGSVYGSRAITATVVKKANMTDEMVVDALVEKLNGNPLIGVMGFLKAQKVATSLSEGGTALSIGIAPLDKETTIDVQLQGLLENTPIYKNGEGNSRAFVAGFGSKEDVTQMAKEAAVFSRGDSGYREDREGWFSADLDVADSGYDIVHILEEGLHETPSISRSVMHKQLTIAIPKDATASSDIVSKINLVFSTSFTKDSGAEVGAKEDGSE